MTTIGLLHPGEMGASVGASGRASGQRVLWASQGRGADTAARAAAAGLEDAGTVAALVGASDVVLSVCPPHAALDVARSVAGPLPRPLRGRQRGGAGHRAHDRPDRRGGRRHLRGRRHHRPATRQARYAPGSTCRARPPSASRRSSRGGPLEAIVLAGDLTAASAIKMAYAAWTKGSQALIMAVRALATAEGVDEALLAEWHRSQPDLPKRSENAAKGTARKAWRWVGEMDEIAATFAADGLPDGFHRAASELYRRMAIYKDAAAPPSMEDVAKTLLKESGA